MARLARVVVPGVPHHVTQRGNRRQQTFFSAAHYALYRDLLAEHCAAANVQCWAFCLMPNHVHLTLVPADEGGLRRALGEAHRRYTRAVNVERGWTGYLWQGRFASAPMDEPHTLAAFRYIALNPVRARLAERAEDWEWSSARAWVQDAEDGLTRIAPFRERVDDASAFLTMDRDAEDEHRRLRRAETTGRPIGAAEWVRALEAAAGRPLAPRRRGPPPRLRPPPTTDVDTPKLL